jgi:hypothetical protein
MTLMHSRRWAGAAAPAVIVLALGGALTGCRDGAVVVSSGTPASAAAGTSTGSAADTASGIADAEDAGAAPSSAAGTAASATPAAGSVTASVSAPVTVSGTAQVPVSCVTGAAYRATVDSAVVDGDQLSYTVAIPRYTGPGSYYTVVGVTLRQASGVVTAVGRVSSVPAQITAAGGSFTVSAVGSGGRTLAGSRSWTCGE